jgi:hypothetical protein
MRKYYFVAHAGTNKEKFLKVVLTAGTVRVFETPNIADASSFVKAEDAVKWFNFLKSNPKFSGTVGWYQILQR